MCSSGLARRGRNETRWWLSADTSCTPFRSFVSFLGGPFPAEFVTGSILSWRHSKCSTCHGGGGRGEKPITYSLQRTGRPILHRGYNSSRCQGLVRSFLLNTKPRRRRNLTWSHQYRQRTIPGRPGFRFVLSYCTHLRWHESDADFGLPSNLHYT